MSIICNQSEHDAIAQARDVELAKRAAVAKGFPLGSPEATLATAHRAGKHAAAKARECTLCHNKNYTRPTGPGSERHKMSMSAWETQTAAARRKT